MKCRNCGSANCSVVLDLVASPPSNSLLSPEDLQEAELYYPLCVFACQDCWLVQLPEHKRAQDIFAHQYPYFSSYSTTWLQHAKEFAERTRARFNLTRESRVIEIGSNDGYLLRNFHPEIPSLGIEPTPQTADVARSLGIPCLVEYFGTSTAYRLIEEDRLADLLVVNNVLAHVPNLHDFVRGCRLLLKEDGVLSVEFPHLVNLLRFNQFDTIYHEHFSYFSLKVICNVFARHDLLVFDVEEIPTHGGSLRVFASHLSSKRFEQNNRVSQIIDEEEAAGIFSTVTYLSFARRVSAVRSSFLRFLLEAESAGQSITGYGAAAKAATLLNYSGVKPDQIAYVADKSPYKQGKFLPGSHLPIVSPEEILSTQPNYIIIFPWNIAGEISQEMADIRRWGGKFVTIIPQLTVW